MPNFSFPHYRSKRKFEKIPGQRVAGGLSNVSLAKGKKAAHSGLKAPPCSLYVRKNPDRGSLRLTKSKILPQYQNSLIAHFAPAGILLGSAFPKPCHAAYAAYPAAAMRQSKGGFTMRKRYNTPHRSRVVKTRMTEEEYAEFADRKSTRLNSSHRSQSRMPSSA